MRRFKHFRARLLSETKRTRQERMRRIKIERVHQTVNELLLIGVVLLVIFLAIKTGLNAL